MALQTFSKATIQPKYVLPSVHLERFGNEIFNYKHTNRTNVHL